MDKRSFRTLKLARRGRVMRVTFDNPPVNLMDRTMTGELRDLLQLLREDEETSVVVFDSANADFFISHGDLNMFARFDEPPQRSEKLNFIHRLFEGYRTLPKATIALVEGRVNGAGTEFAHSLDMQFAAIGRARIGQFEVALGCLPGGTGTQRLPRLAGRARALEVILGCDEFDAETAALYGLVNRALPADEIGPFVDRLAGRIASFPPRAIALSKAAVDAGLPDPVPGLREESYLAGQLMATQCVADRFERILALGAQTREGELDLPRLLERLGDRDGR